MGMKVKVREMLGSATPSPPPSPSPSPRTLFVRIVPRQHDSNYFPTTIVRLYDCTAFLDVTYLDVTFNGCEAFLVLLVHPCQIRLEIHVRRPRRERDAEENVERHKNLGVVFAKSSVRSVLS